MGGEGGTMSSDVRYQRKCYFATPEYSSTLWGKFGYIYQGKGSLRLTTDSLCLDGCSHAFEAPFHTIKSVGLSRFSTWAKPLGLSRLSVTYVQDGEAHTIFLIPFESVFDSTIVTSKLVESWFDSLRKLDVLSNRIEPPQVAPRPALSLVFALTFFALVIVIPSLLAYSLLIHVAAR